MDIGILHILVLVVVFLYFKDNILPDEAEIIHDDGNYFEVCVEGKIYSCDIYGNGDFYHNVANFNFFGGLI